MRGKSHYLTLGIQRGASAEGIRRAFREQVKTYHPDRVGPARAEYFEQILAAYHMLGNPARRRDYDRDLPEEDAGPASRPEPLGANNSRGLPQVSSAWRSVDMIRDPLFEAGLAEVSRNFIAAQIPRRESPERLTVQVVLSPAEALRGGMLDLALPGCSPCSRCGGAGRQGLFPCDLCDGEGVHEEEEIVRIRVPANVGDGALIEVPLRGLGLHLFYLCARIRVAS